MKSAEGIIRIIILVPLAYVVLYFVVARTHMIEKIMAPAAGGWALLLVLLFFVARITAYLLVPSLVLSLAAYLGMKSLFGRGSARPGQATAPRIRRRSQES